jgi:hypothetical protein
MVESNLVAFHESIAAELNATQNRVRNLIGSNHWPSDGEHKEAILRKILRNHIPLFYHVGRGFVRFKEEASKQIDILVTDEQHPTLFRDGDLKIVTPDAVRAIIEVKTKQNATEISDTINKLSEQLGKINSSNNNLYDCWGGLFVFDEGDLEEKKILKEIAISAKKFNKGEIDCIAIGPNIFIKYWKNGRAINSKVNGNVYHSYDLQNLSFSYFIGNLVTSHLNWERSINSQYAWFPVERGKESKRSMYIDVDDAVAEPKRF